ncbi:Uncharacterised protein [Vibrio cholerae]|nr:Uncharacterised protein [Vibrio cholerae]
MELDPNLPNLDLMANQWLLGHHAMVQSVSRWLK